MATKNPFDIAGECIAFGVRRVSRLVTNHYDHYLAATGMRSTQFTLLNALQALEEVTINELAEQLLADRTTLTRNLNLLIDKGWVVKARGRDRRKRLLQLTESGRRRLNEASRAWQEAQDALLERLGDKRYRRLMADLEYVEETFV